MNNFFNAFADKLDVYIIGIVLLSGFFQKIYLKVWIISKDDSYNSALKTLIVSAVVSSVYIVLLKDPEKANNWAKYFISYFTATSAYELLISPFSDWLKLRFANQNKP